MEILECYGRVLLKPSVVSPGGLLLVLRQSQKGFDVAFSFHSDHLTGRGSKLRGEHGKNSNKGEDVAYEASFK
jgi:hypothetical protein